MSRCGTAPTRHRNNRCSSCPQCWWAKTTGSGGLLGTLSQLGINLGANSVLLKFSRGAETEADLLGTRLMHSAGYNPTELADFFRKLEAEGGNQNKLVEMFMSSHPNPGNRVQAVQKEAKSLPPRSLQRRNGAVPQHAGTGRQSCWGMSSRGFPTASPWRVEIMLAASSSLVWLPNFHTKVYHHTFLYSKPASLKLLRNSGCSAGA